MAMTRRVSKNRSSIGTSVIARAAHRHAGVADTAWEADPAASHCAEIEERVRPCLSVGDRRPNASKKIHEMAPTTRPRGRPPQRIRQEVYLIGGTLKLKCVA
jgi:hypothetical protein